MARKRQIEERKQKYQGSCRVLDTCRTDVSFDFSYICIIILVNLTIVLRPPSRPRVVATIVSKAPGNSDPPDSVVDAIPPAYG